MPLTSTNKLKKPIGCDLNSLHVSSGGNTPQGFMKTTQVGCFKKLERKFDPQRSVMMADEDIESESDDE